MCCIRFVITNVSLEFSYCLYDIYIYYRKENVSYDSCSKKFSFSLSDFFQIGFVFFVLSLWISLSHCAMSIGKNVFWVLCFSISICVEIGTLLYVNIEGSWLVLYPANKKLYVVPNKHFRSQKSKWLLFGY